MSDFSYQPVYGAQVNKAPRVKSARFGDGYEQRVADGINIQPQVWNLTFTYDTSTIGTIDTFLATKAGITSFTWTPTGFSEIKVVCREWSRGIDTPTTGTIQATFEQVFE